MVNGYTSCGLRQKLPVGELSMGRPDEFEQGNFTSNQENLRSHFLF